MANLSGKILVGGDVGKQGFQYIENLVENPPDGFVLINEEDRIEFRFDHLSDFDLDEVETDLQSLNVEYGLYVTDEGYDIYTRHYDPETDEAGRGEALGEDKPALTYAKLYEILQAIQDDKRSASKTLVEAVEDELGHEIQNAFEPAPLTVMGYDYRRFRSEDELKASILT